MVKLKVMDHGEVTVSIRVRSSEVVAQLCCHLGYLKFNSWVADDRSDLYY